MSHTVSITPDTKFGVFTLSCTCRQLGGINAIKWLLLDVQRHYVEHGLTGQGQGLIVDKIAGDGLER